MESKVCIRWNPDNSFKKGITASFLILSRNHFHGMREVFLLKALVLLKIHFVFEKISTRKLFHHT
jgi:hypothetical protein